MKGLLSLCGAFSVAVCAATAGAQTNSVAGTDIQLSQLGGLKYWGRSGTFPAGENGFSMSTTACNIGTTNVSWFAPMNTNHPMISFMIVRQENGRMEQISDRSYVKHGFFATNSTGCATCTNQGGNPNTLFIGCADTYGTTNNADNYYLGPPSEIDPWLGKWTSQCSHFDKGVPPVGPPNDCDNLRSLTSGQAATIGPVHNRMVVADSDLDHPAATFYYQGQYTVGGEPEVNRGNNVASRSFVPTWTGSAWSVSTGPAQVQDSVLQQWAGATVSSGTNGPDDGRIYIGVRVTPIGAGQYHYDYAVHNRDNRRAAGSFRVPIHPAAVATNYAFRDIDGNASNDWSATRLPNEIVFTAPSNPLEWNTIFNFSFDSDGVDLAGNATIDAFYAGTGASSFAVATRAPLDLCVGATTYCTAKVNSLGCIPTISGSGLPSASAATGFTIDAVNEVSSTNGLFFYGATAAQAIGFQGGTLCMLAPVVRTNLQNSGGSPPNQDCTGTFSMDFNTYILFGADPSLVAGVTVRGQYWSRDINDTTGFGIALSNALQFTICP